MTDKHHQPFENLQDEIHHDEEDDHHVPLSILALVGLFVAVLIVLPNILGAKRRDKRD